MQFLLPYYSSFITFVFDGVAVYITLKGRGHINKAKLIFVDLQLI